MHAFDDDVMRPTKALHDTESVAERANAGPERARGAGALSTDAARLVHLQRAVGNAGVVQLLSSEDDPHGLQKLSGGGGSPLDRDTKVQMESAIGADFSDVRVHTGSDADQSAKSLGAHAYTSGNDVVFADGHYSPGSPDGQRTLAHELTHVVQQRSGPVEGEMTSTGVQLSDPSDRHEQAAEANADRVMSGMSGGEVATPAPAAGASVQRHADEEQVQALHDPAATVQRAEGAPEEEEVQALHDPGASVQREGGEEEEAEG
jgi:hypothetical protein